MRAVDRIVDRDFLRKMVTLNLLFFSLWCFPALVGGGVMGPVSSGQESEAGQDAGENRSARLKRFRLEVSGGFARTASSGLNLLADYQRRLRQLRFDDYLNLLEAREDILSWSKNQDGDFKNLEWSASLCLRGKYLLNRKVAVSLGVHYLSGLSESVFSQQYDRTYSSGIIDKEITIYSPFSLKVRATAPLAGIHFLWMLDEAASAEVYLSGGPLFAECRYLSEFSYEWIEHLGGEDTLIFSSEGMVEQKGEGTGVAFELGARISHPLSGRLDFFCEGGYALIKAPRISGTGREVMADGSREWDGQWAIKSIAVTMPWGEANLEYPTNDWPDGSSDARLRSFQLNLSGFRLTMGLSLRF